MKKLILSAVYMISSAAIVQAQTSESGTPPPPVHKQWNDSTAHHRAWGNKQPNEQHGQYAHDWKGKVPGPGQGHGEFDKRGPWGHGFAKRGPWGQRGGKYLTPEQQKQSKAINEAYHKEVAALQQNEKLSLGEYKTKLAALKKEHRSKIEGLLTTTQKSDIAAHHKSAEINQKVRQVAHLEKLKLTLGLTEDQVAKIKSNEAALHNKLKAIHENETLLPEEKREALKKLSAERKEVMSAVLTPEQKVKADSLMKNNHGGRFQGGWNGHREQFSK